MKNFILVLVVFISAHASGQDLNTQLDDMMKKKYKPGEPGAVALIAKGGKPVFRQAYGMADLENDVVMTPEHVFEIGSITKQFTGVCVLMLMEQGKLSLEDPITKFISDYPTHDNIITVRHLLTHTSGIKSYTSLEPWTKLWRLDKTPLEMIAIFKDEPMDFAPGEQWEYNNSAYFILGYIIEKASGIPYPEFLDKNIFKPLGMKNSYYGSMSKIIKNRAHGYQKQENYVNAEYLSLTQPYSAGSIMSTVDDLLIWQNAVSANTLVKKESIQKAFTGYTLKNGKDTHYGFGWGLNEINGSPTREHSGGIFGYTSNGIYLPTENVYVIVLSNCDCNPPGDVSTEMAAVAINKPFPLPVAKIKLDEAYAKSLTGVYEFDDKVIRMISYEDGQLYSQREGGTKLKIFPQDKVTFSFETGFVLYKFDVDKNGVKSLTLKNRIDESKGIKTNRPVPEGRKEIKLQPDILQQYAGRYELSPSFAITVFVNEGHLMGTPTGQPTVELFAESESKFFLKVVDAQIEFFKNSEGNVDSMILHQGGQNIKGIKK